MAHVLLLMVAGLMSGMVGNLSPFGPLSPVLLGVSLAAYLLLRAGVDSPSRLGLVVAAAVAGYYVMIIGGFAGLMVLLMLRDYAPRSIELAAAPGAAVGAGVVALAFLSVLPSQRDHLKLEVACCAILVALSTFLWPLAAYVQFRWLVGTTGWNGAVATSLALVAYLRTRSGESSATALRIASGAGLAAACMLFLIGDRLHAAPEARLVRVESPTAVAFRESMLKSLNEAPPLVNLPEVADVPASAIFRRPVAGFACFPPREALFITPDPVRVESVERRMQSRSEYRLQCYLAKEGPHSRTVVHVTVARYPNEEWARYDLRYPHGYHSLPDQRTVNRLVRHGRPIFVRESRTYWASVDKIVTISAPAEVLQTFVDAYLELYPSTLEPEFDLPYRPPTSY